MRGVGFFWQGLETVRAGSSGDRTTEVRGTQQRRRPRRLSHPWKNAIDFCYKPHWLDFGTGRVNTGISIYWYYSAERGHLPKTEGLCAVTPKVTLLRRERKGEGVFFLQGW